MVAENMLRLYDVKKVFSEKKIGFDGSFVVAKCLQQVGIPDLVHMYAYWNEQPSSIKTMRNMVNNNN